MNVQTAYESLCERGYQRQSDRDEAVAAKIDSLLDGEYNPFDADNLAESMDALTEAEKAELKKAAESGDKLQFASILLENSNWHWETRAEKEALRLIAKERDDDHAEAAADRRAA